MDRRIIGISKQNILRLIGSSVAVLLLIYLLSRQGWNDIEAAISRLGLGSFLLAFGLIVGSRLAFALRWYILLRGVGTEITLWRSFRITFAGLFATNFLPTTIGGDVVRFAGTFDLNLDRALCVASLLVDRLVGIMCMAVLLPFGLIPLLGIPSSRKSINWRSPFVLTLILWLTIGEISGHVREKSKAFILRLLQSLDLWMHRPRFLIGAVISSFMHMSFLFATIWYLLEGIDEALPILLIAGLWSIIYFLTLLPVSINGLGVQEISLTYVFASIGGVSMRGSLTLAILIRTLLILASLPGVLFLPPILSNVKRINDNS
ncbi:MAG TPA: flippase-like domain-containing protein [Anaerolineae bacterium]|nr:flippase-like domain-containing protein [Anaerolineae bacterium]